jgi:hypothetical protein
MGCTSRTSRSTHSNVLGVIENKVVSALVYETFKKERERLESINELFEYAPFFKSNRPKKYFESMLENGDIDK